MSIISRSHEVSMIIFRITKILLYSLCFCIFFYYHIHNIYAAITDNSAISDISSNTQRQVTHDSQQIKHPWSCSIAVSNGILLYTSICVTLLSSIIVLYYAKYYINPIQYIERVGLLFMALIPCSYIIDVASQFILAIISGMLLIRCFPTDCRQNYCDILFITTELLYVILIFSTIALITKRQHNNKINPNKSQN